MEKGFFIAIVSHVWLWALAPEENMSVKLFCLISKAAQSKMQMTAKHWWPQRLLKHLKLCEETATILLWPFLQLGFEHVLIICLGSHGLDAMMLALVLPCKASAVVGHTWFHFFLPNAASHAARPG